MEHQLLENVRNVVKEVATAMPVFFFDTRDGEELEVDEVGVECANWNEAKLQAVRGLSDLARDVIPDSTTRDLTIEVRDQQSRLLLRTTILF